MIIILLFLGLIYLAIILVMVGRQRKFIFAPTNEGPSLPSDFGARFTRIALPSKESSLPAHALHGWFVHDPSRENAESRPVLVYLQGNAGALSDRAKVAALFDSLGVDTVMLSYRGYGDSGFGAIVPAEQQLYEDAQTAYDFARTRVPADRIIVWGHSLGAAVAAHLSAHNPVAGLILESPFTSVASMVRVRHPWLFVPSFLIFHKFPTLDYVRRLRCPVLVAVAQQDAVIPPLFGAQVFAVAPAPKTFVALAGVGHSDLPEEFERFRPEIQNFIDRVVRI